MNSSIKNINPNLPIPLYYQLKILLLEYIQSGEWEPGYIIPTEQELMSRYSVSRTTVREAVTTLVQEGYLTKKQGKGTFVREHQMKERLGRLTGFTEEMIEKGYIPSAELIGVFHDLANDENFIELELPNEETWTKIARSRLASGKPVAIERSYWPNEIADLLCKEDLQKVAYYDVLERNGLFLKYAEEEISAVNADKTDAALLNVKVGAALIEMKRMAYDQSDRLIECTNTRYRGDRYKYHVRLER